ncbi:ubiquinone biosynthesis protein [Desulfacinum hydrothermale DSM 13146]|uniref:Ubiquinone biosynthesis protein n=1 Tax=Desulfacinum hydrothermale DSM 13146 TaxID=1121390 RepID=A0A1W1WXB6_9BACT|nr:AarF/UbiB family protein [Desulfacinum hydrothermale]SMC16295.1 ubiquinone biosynthesis protein [Desulfacinum hydrothermale DSM 13146]
MEFRAITHLGRFKDIAVILIRYGFDDVLDRLGFPAQRLLGPRDPAKAAMTTWERVRHALEDLGPTFIKFGQMMSLRPDLIPYPLIQELRKLRDEVASVPFSQVKTVVEQGLGRPLKEVFVQFEEEPLASASMAQVHRAVLRQERMPVAVKVQRPGIRQVIKKDLYILEAIAHEVHERVEDYRVYELPKLAKELRRSMLRELDFTLEARNIRIFRSNFRQHPDVFAPAVMEEHCTRQILTMELVQGRRLAEVMLQDGRDLRRQLARRGLKAMIKQILEDGFFHADPHPGNILVTDDGRLCFLDWGMVGRLTRPARHDLIDLIHAIVAKDSERVLEILLAFVRGGHDEVHDLLHRELLDLLDAYHGVPLGRFDLGALLMDMSNLLRDYRLYLPSDLAMMVRSLITAEGTARELAPDLNVIAEAEGKVKHLAAQRWHPSELLRGVRRSLRHMAQMQREVPPRFVQILDKIGRGDLEVRFRHENLGDMRRTLDNMSNRLTLALIIAAMIIGSSMIITTGVKPFLFGYPALGIIGYLVSGVLGLYLVITILRSRRY